MRVLIAEDNALERRMLQAAVELLGHDCRAAADGAEAWRLYQEWGADVVISDWLMPGLDGQELCQRLRAQSQVGAQGGIVGAREGSGGPSTGAALTVPGDRPGTRPYTYFLFLTMLDDKQHLMAGLQAGADDYLIKPVDIEDLAARFTIARRIKDLEEERLQLLATEHAARVQAEQAVQLRDEVLAAVSHDLKAPITAIRGTAQVLQRRMAVAGLSGGGSDSTPADRARAPVLEGLERIAATAMRMSIWIEDLLDASQLAMEQSLRLRCAPADLVALAQQAAADQQRTTKRHRLRVQSALRHWSEIGMRTACAGCSTTCWPTLSSTAQVAYWERTLQP
jgi:DNA-binding response OmpR family regulator